MKNLIIILLLIIVLFVLHTINKKTKQRVFISLAPDDNHIQFVEKTIQSLLSQDKMPHKIILNIPKHIQIPHSLYRNQFRDKIKINRCKKNSANNLFLPIMANKKKLGINPEDKILFACDKTLYQKDFINNMCANQKGNTAVINKNVSSHLNPVLIKSMSIHNLDEDIISEEEETRSLSQNIPEEEYAEINKPQIINYSNEITKKLKLNKGGRKRVKKYKDFFVSIVIFFIVTLFLFSVSSIFDENNSGSDLSVNDNYKSSIDLLVTLLLLVIYGLTGYAVFEADAISKMERSETEGEKIKRLQIELKKRNQALEIGKRGDIINIDNIILRDGTKINDNEEAFNRLLRKDEGIIKEILDNNSTIKREDIDKLIRIVARTYVSYQERTYHNNSN